MNAQVLAALEKSQWSGRVPNSKSARRCVACERTEKGGIHSADCYIGQALQSASLGGSMLFTASDDGREAKQLHIATDGLFLLLTNATQPPQQMRVERRVYVDSGGVKAHVWTHHKDRSTKMTTAGCKLIEQLSVTDVSDALRGEPSRYYQYIGSQDVDLACIEVQGDATRVFRKDWSLMQAEFTPGDVAKLVEDGKLVEIERPARLAA